MSRIGNLDMSLVRGDDFVKTMVFRNKFTRVALDVSDWEFNGQVRETPDAADTVAEFSFDTTDASNGVVIASLAADDTAEMNNRFYYYDIETTVDDLKRTRVSGRVNMTKDVTRAA